MQSISTKNLNSRKTVLIDNDTYVVRKFSNLEQLDISQYRRRIIQLQELQAVENLPEYNEEAEQIARDLFNIYVNLFDDGGDQSKTKQLFNTLSYEDIESILKDIFKTPEITSEETPSA